ncbi:uncharacterized protein C11orf52 homolog [Pelodytes ibericus]
MPLLQSPPPVVHTYDTVTDFPVYAVVDKSKKTKMREDEAVQYAEIQVLRKPTVSQKKAAVLPNHNDTEYATLDFPREYNAVKGTLV